MHDAASHARRASDLLNGPSDGRSTLDLALAHAVTSLALTFAESPELAPAAASADSPPPPGFGGETRL